MGRRRTFRAEAAQSSMRCLWLGALLVLTACAKTATMTPLNPEAQHLGSPKFEYTATGLGQGPVTITMPDGELLNGSWSVAQGGGFATAVGPGGSASAFVLSGGGNFFVAATGPKTSLACQGNVSFGHGGGICRTPDGTVYQMMF
jgi:hypothetical protein